MIQLITSICILPTPKQASAHFTALAGACVDIRHFPNFNLLFYEVAKEDGTIGLVCPFVAKYNDQLYIAVERNERHAGERVEVARKAWDNPSDLPKIPEGAKFERHDLGLGDSNTARIIGGDGIVDQIVILSDLEELPALPGKPFWMKLQTYAETRDKMGQSVIGKAYMKGLLP